MKLLLVRVLLITGLISFVPITTAMPQEAAANASLTERAAGGNTAEARIPDLLRQFNDSLQAIGCQSFSCGGSDHCHRIWAPGRQE
jgi:hypothetical protein